MTLRRTSQRVAAFFLLLTLAANFILSVFWPQWHSALPWHEHIIIGPVYPGWEDHHSVAARPDKQAPFQGESSLILTSIPTISSAIAAKAGSKVISVYRLPAGDETVVSFSSQLLWLETWLALPEPSSLVQPVQSTFLPPSNAFLPPPEKPPASTS